MNNPWDIFMSQGFFCIMIKRGYSIMNEKKKVALSSVVAAIFLTAMKLTVGVITGSLGILSEAAHSALDLGAAVITFFAVKISDKPADKEHNYGHGKIESFSALIETLLLLVTCVWIIYEAVERLFYEKSSDITNTYWGMAIILISMIVDITRSRALKKAAEQYGSQALAADALHFSSDVLSSLVVFIGLACVTVGNVFKVKFLYNADPVAALGVSILVIIISFRLGKQTVEVLLDTAPKGMLNQILHEVNQINGVLDVANVRVRASGPRVFIDLDIGINRNESHRVVHSIVNEVRERLERKITGCDVMISTYPVDTAGEDQEIYHTVKKIVDNFPICTNIHNIHVYEVAGEKYIAIHLEVKESMNLTESHHLSHEIGDLISQQLQDVRDVSVNFEYVKRQYITAEDVTDQNPDIISQIKNLVNKVPERLNCHDIKIYSQGGKLTIFLHCEMKEEYSIEKIENISKAINEKIKSNIREIDSIHMHVEPM
jgi:cation diffusion facilitator family transporter